MVPVHERIDVSEAEGKPLPDQREIKHGAMSPIAERFGSKVIMLPRIRTERRSS